MIFRRLITMIDRISGLAKIRISFAQSTESFALNFPIFDLANDVQRLHTAFDGSFGFIQVQVGFA